MAPIVVGSINMDLAVAAPRLPAAGETLIGDGFAVGLVRGRGAVEAPRFATLVAGLSVAKRGAQPSMPTAHEVQEHAVATAGAAR